MADTSAHPCFSCTLPDCDDENRRCGLRRALNLYYACLKRNEPVPDKIRVARNIAYNELYGARHREISASRYHRGKLAKAEAERAHV
jgi:hypothetical protein